MDFYGDDIDEDLLIEVPCEFCNDPFPLFLITEHQTGCRYDLVRVIEPTVEEIEAQFNSSPLLQEEKKEIVVETLINQNIVQFAATPPAPKKETLQKEKTPVLKEKVQKNDNNTAQDFHAYEVLEEDILQENETTFTFGSATNQGKRVEEEKPSFKVPSISILSNNDSKYLIHNDLPDSDNEEGESLEEFWRKADIKLAQRLKAFEKKKPDRKF